MMTRSRSRFRILALDVDGTLLDGRGELRPRTREAVAKAARAGIRPVLCTGRRYRRARPVAEALGLDAPLVCNSGALVKDPSTHQTLWRADFADDLLAAILGLFREHGEPVVGFADRPLDDHDFVVANRETGRAMFDEYVSMNHEHAHVDPEWAEGRADPQFHICAVGDRTAMQTLEAVFVDRFGEQIRTFVQRSPIYSGTMCEVLRGDASKWSAVLHLAGLWRVSPEEICAIGDDMNDAPMIAGAGFGVAMAHAPETVRAVADHVTSGNDDDGVAEFIEGMLLRTD